MWGKIKSFIGSRRTLKELVEISKGVFDVFCNNKKKIAISVFVFGLIDVAMFFMAINYMPIDPVTKEFTEAASQVGLFVGVLSVISSLFIPVIIYTILKKSSFTLVNDFEEHVGIFTKLIKKYSIFSMLSRSYKTIIIMCCSLFLGYFAWYQLVQRFVPALFGLQDIESMNLGVVFFIIPFVLFSAYVLIVGTSIAIVKSLSTELSVKKIVVFSILKSLKSFFAVLLMLVIYVSIELLYSYTLGDYVYVTSFFDKIMLALVVFVIYVMSLDKEKMEL